jgi:hypothetical protein
MKAAGTRSRRALNSPVGHALATGERGGQPRYLAITIETSLRSAWYFISPLRQTEGLLQSIAAVIDVDILCRLSPIPP